MPEAAQNGLLPARDVVRSTPLSTAANGLAFASFGYTEVPADSLRHIVEAVPPSLAVTLARHAFYFVPLAIGETPEAAEALSGAPGAEPDATPDAELLEIARGFSPELADRASCHRNLSSEGIECTFISARLMQDRFALAFEFFINVGHQLVDHASVPPAFYDLLWAQARAGVRGETSQDAWETRRRALDALPLAAAAGASAHASATGASPDSIGPAPGFGISLAASRETGRDLLDSPVAPSPRSFALSPRTDRTLAGLGSGSRMGLGSQRESTPGSSGPAFSGLTFSGPSASAPSPAEPSVPAPPPSPQPSPQPSPDQLAFFEAAFADTLAIYMLSLSMDVDYADLREREYPLLAAPALADRLRLAAELFPPAPGYEFAIRYRRRR